MKIFKSFLLIPIVLLILNQPVSAANWDGNYQVTEWTQTCDSLIAYRDGYFSVSNGEVLNLGASTPINADGTAVVNHYDNPAWMTLYLTFSNNGTTNIAEGTWEGDSQSGYCTGTIKAESPNLFPSFSSPIIIVPIIICCILLLGVSGIVVIIIITRRRGHHIQQVQVQIQQQPEQVPIQPVQVPPVQVQPAQGPQLQPVGFGPNDVFQNQPVQPTATAPVVPPVAAPKAPVNQPRRQQPRKFRPVYGKKTIPKKTNPIWPELTRKK